jgi:hypothetical protein
MIAFLLVLAVIGERSIEPPARRALLDGYPEAGQREMTIR